jgi:undecaprenyl-diphosphatase
MDLFQAAVLGIIQGLTEFIPVSSSGHLDLIPRLLGWEQSTTFIQFLHFGTLLSLLIYFRKQIVRYINVSLKILKKENLKRKQEKDLKVIRNVGITIIPAVIFGVLFESLISKFYDNNDNRELLILVVLVPLVLVGILFLFEERLFKNNKKEIDDLTPRDSLIVGLLQALAFIRGISRSGITLLAAQAKGLKRVDAAEFSFLMSIPIITGTSLYSIYKLIKLPAEQLQSEIPLAIVGFIASFISGLFAVNFLLRFLRSNSLRIFGLYRIIFAIIIFIVVFVA